MARIWNRRLPRFSLIVGTILLLGLAGIYTVLAQESQPPSEFDITTDGKFTDGDEWSDVAAAVRLGGDLLVYTATDPGNDDLYLMYDFVASTVELGDGEVVGPIHFHNAGHECNVFVGLAGAVVDEVACPILMEGAVGFNGSPNSATPHLMVELEVELAPVVLVSGAQKRIGANHGPGYSRDPSHWGASLPRDRQAPRDPQPPQGECGDPVEQTRGLPIPLVKVHEQALSGEAVSNACVNVDEAGGIQIDLIPLPGEFGVPPVFQCPNGDDDEDEEDDDDDDDDGCFDDDDDDDDDDEEDD